MEIRGKLVGGGDIDPGRKSEWNGGFAAPGAGGEGASSQDPHKRQMGMCRWMGSHFHDWSDYNGVAHFPIFGRYYSSSYLRLANVPECLYRILKVKCSSFNVKNGSIHKNRKRLSWDRENYIVAQK